MQTNYYEICRKKVFPFDQNNYFHSHRWQEKWMVLLCCVTSPIKNLNKCIYICDADWEIKVEWKCWELRDCDES